jgi:N-acetyl-alpha-D-muramate 1-phosphate uridylyltransferase
MQNKLKQAMIFAAGRGSRLSPITNTIPKALLPIDGVPLLEQLILKLQKEGIERIVVNVHHFASQIIDFLKAKNNFSIDILISDETDKLLDTGGGLVKAKQLFYQNEPILLYNVDILSSIDIDAMYKFHCLKSPIVTLAVRDRKTSRYLEFDTNLNLIGRFESNLNIENGDEILLNNHKALAFSGIHIINPGIFDLINETGVFSIVDLYIRICKEFQITGYLHNADNWMDCGTYDKIKSLLKPIHL